MSSAAEVAARWAVLRDRIDRAASRAGRGGDAVTLVGASKGQPADAVVAAVRAGLTDVAESFAQEARDKLPAVREALAEVGCGAPRWGFIGRLQRNKVRSVVPWADVIECVDRLSLAQEIDRRATGLHRRVCVLLQVDLCGEPQKGGAPAAALPELLEHCRRLEGIRLRGLMTVPALGADAESARPVFARLRELRDGLEDAASLPELSMGMSGDFEVAIEEGATRVRIGTALFGPRETGARRTGTTPSGDGEERR